MYGNGPQGGKGIPERPPLGVHRIQVQNMDDSYRKPQTSIPMSSMRKQHNRLKATATNRLLLYT